MNHGWAVLVVIDVDDMGHNACVFPTYDDADAAGSEWYTPVGYGVIRVEKKPNYVFDHDARRPVAIERLCDEADYDSEKGPNHAASLLTTLCVNTNTRPSDWGEERQKNA